MLFIEKLHLVILEKGVKKKHIDYVFYDSINLSRIGCLTVVDPELRMFKLC